MRCCVAVLSVLTLVASLRAEPGLPAFRLKDADGKAWSQEDLRDARAVAFVFLGTQCPVNNAYLPRLVELNARFAAQGVRFLGVNANEHDSADAVRAHVRR